MKNRVEPPVLLSRLLLFVFATSIVTLAVMGFTLAKLFPINHPQVFFLTTTPNSEITIALANAPLRDPVFEEEFQRSFILEYIRARNEISPNQNAMRAAWKNDSSAAIKTLSSDAVWMNFVKTRMWNTVMRSQEGMPIICTVEFSKDGDAITRQKHGGGQQVKFSHICKKSEINDGQLYRKDYTISVELEYDNNIGWTQRLTNPLGLKVSSYKVTEVRDADGIRIETKDPLDFSINEI